MKSLTFSVVNDSPRVDYENPELVMKNTNIAWAFDNLSELSVYLLNHIYGYVTVTGLENAEPVYANAVLGYFRPVGDTGNLRKRFGVWENTPSMQKKFGRITVHLPCFEFV